MPVVFLNEIDDLIREDLVFLRALRGFHDEGKARFIMTGYFQAAASGRDIHAPLFHWTSSPDGRPFIVLAELSDDAARGLVGLLEQPPLELNWESLAEKERGVRALLEHSYRIPHLLQALCLGLVSRLDEKRRTRLRASDIEAVARQPEYSAWHHVNRFELGNLIPRGEMIGDVVGDHLIYLLLLIAVKKLYFQGNPMPIRESIRQRDPRSLSFDAHDLDAWFPEVLGGLLRGAELVGAQRFLDRIDLEGLLFNLSLTLILSYDPELDRHFFQSHLYPIEIDRQLKASGQRLDDRILKQLLPLYRHWSPEDAILGRHRKRPGSNYGGGERDGQEEAPL